MDDLSLPEVAGAIDNENRDLWTSSFAEPPDVVTRFSGDEDLSVSEWLLGVPYDKVSCDDGDWQMFSPFTSTTPEAGSYYLASAALNLLRWSIESPTKVGNHGI